MQAPLFINIINYVVKPNVTYGATVLVTRRCSSLMRCIMINEYGKANLLRLQEIPVPQADNTEVLVRLKAAGVNPVDCLIREGAFMTVPELPLILGKEAAGIVENVGPSVKSFKVGDRVTCCLPKNGGYAEYVTCQEKHLIPLSDKLSFSQGATLYVAYFVAYRALVTKCKIKEGETLLIHGGSGGVGIAAIQIAKSRGVTVYSTASTEEGLNAMKSAGADHVFNHKSKEHILKVAASVNIKGFDVILENCADENLGKDLLLVGKMGRIAIVGGGTSPRCKNPKPVTLNPRSLIWTEGRILGVNLGSMTEEDFEETKEEIVKCVEGGWIRPIINKELPLSQASLAHKFMESDSGAHGKIVLYIGSKS